MIITLYKTSLKIITQADLSSLIFTNGLFPVYLSTGSTVFAIHEAISFSVIHSYDESICICTFGTFSSKSIICEVTTFYHLFQERQTKKYSPHLFPKGKFNYPLFYIQSRSDVFCLFDHIFYSLLYCITFSPRDFSFSSLKCIISDIKDDD